MSRTCRLILRSVQPRRESNRLWLPIVGALIALAALSLFGFWKRQRRVDAKAIER